MINFCDIMTSMLRGGVKCILHFFTTLLCRNCSRTCNGKTVTSAAVFFVTNLKFSKTK